MLINEQEVCAVTELISTDYVFNIYKCYGKEIEYSFKLVLRQIPHILKSINLRNHSSVIIFHWNKEDIDPHLTFENITNYSHLTDFSKKCLLINIIGFNDILVCSTDEEYDLKNIKEKTFIYEYKNSQDIFHTKEKSYSLPNMPGSESCFTISTFKGLEEALHQYKTNVARYATCSYLKSSIYDKNRIFFKRKPEHYLRDSLNFYLNARLRGDNIEIRPEQIVDTSHPVDIKVTWGNTNSIALIEIKWLGQSINEETKELATEYHESRANDGAKQLVEYLDGNKEQVPNHNTQGYLVVYDLRRKRINKDTRTINVQNGFCYENKEIEYNPDYSKLRDDFHLPIRFFIEPRCEDVS